MYTRQRTLRLADGPDEVHHFVVARFELNRYQDGPGDIPMLDATGPVFAGP
jgi:acyl-CoA dehydrogenase